MLQRWGCQLVFDSIKLISQNQFLRWNHYKSLGLTPSATAADVKNAYYKLSKIHHPDRNNGSEASAKKFRDIVAAYEILGKPDLRRKYDREICKKYETRGPGFGPRKKGTKRHKNRSSSPKIKSSSRSSNSQIKKSKTGGQGLAKNEQEDFEAFIVRALVVACLMCCKKR